MKNITFQEPVITSISHLYNFHTKAVVLRLDGVHPIISGNKWFKLKEYLKEAAHLHKKFILTYGGAYSNHIIATATAASMYGFKSIGIIRGEKPQNISHTLQEAIAAGMELYYFSRNDYAQKIIPSSVFEKYNEDEIYIIPEGGYGIKGAEGLIELLLSIDINNYTHLLAAVGTGTTLAGVAMAAHENQKVIGISVLKNNFSLQKEIENLLPVKKQNQFTLLHNYHFGGYAKYTAELIRFMNEWYTLSTIPTDFVYTAKLFYAADSLIRNQFFEPGSKILVMHSGGLQGNRSLGKGTLIF